MTLYKLQWKKKFDNDITNTIKKNLNKMNSTTLKKSSIIIGVNHMSRSKANKSRITFK
jgi:hypothetical protein